MKKLHSIVSTSTVRVNELKNSFWHSRHRNLHEVILNVYPGGEQSLAKSTTVSNWVPFLYTSLVIHSQRFLIWLKSDEHGVWSRRRTLLAWRNSVFSIQTSLSVKSDVRSNIPMDPAAFWRSGTTCSSIVPMYENICTWLSLLHCVSLRKSPMEYPRHVITAGNHQGHQG